MEAESVQYGRVDSAVRDRRTRWMTAVTKVGVCAIAACLAVMLLSNVIVQVRCKRYSSDTRIIIIISLIRQLSKRNCDNE